MLSHYAIDLIPFFCSWGKLLKVVKRTQSGTRDDLISRVTIRAPIYTFSIQNIQRACRTTIDAFLPSSTYDEPFGLRELRKSPCVCGSRHY